MESMQVGLATRAQFYHWILSLMRVFILISGKSLWQDSFDKIEDLNMDFVRQTQDVIKFSLVTMAILGLILDLVICRYNILAKWLIYFELINAILNSFMPLESGYMTWVLPAATAFSLHVGYSCEQRSSTIAITVFFTFITMMIHPILYNQTTTALAIANRIPLCFAVFIFSAIVGMTVTYIVRIQGRMRNLIIENLKLLDGMHEGLIVISENDLGLKFASRPAIEVLK